MRFTGGVIFSIFASLGLAIAGEATLPQEPQALVDYRVGEMKATGAALKALSQFDPAAGAIGDLSDETARIRTTAARIPDWFRQGTGIGDPGVTKSRALPAIWADWDGFVADAKKLDEAGVALEAAIAANDAAALAAAVDQTGQACAACHKAFRGPEEE